MPTHAAALAARARIRADRHTPDELQRARDDADHAHRLATRIRRLPWQELDACDAHAHIDRAAGTDTGWAVKAQSLRDALIPAGLDPDPLATIEAEIAAQEDEPDAQAPSTQASEGWLGFHPHGTCNPNHPHRARRRA